MHKLPVGILLALATITVGAAAATPEAASAKRVIYYYQTQYNNGTYVSLSPIWTTLNPSTGKPYVTDVMVAAFHLGYTNGTPYIHLNDNVPSDPMFTTMWQEVATLQSYGVTVRMMLGGAAQGSYADLFSQWATFYPILQQTLQQYKLNGIDLDIEEDVSLAHAEGLIGKLSADFGSQFLITMSPVASALWGGANLSGFSYLQLYQSSAGPKIAWFNGQFYSGFATLASETNYEQAINAGYPPDKIVGGMIANSADGSGFVSIGTVAKTVNALVTQYPTFGGVAAWEYFNAEPGGAADPIEWAVDMAKAMQ
jgi:Glycosyl hydrolases family 18